MTNSVFNVIITSIYKAMKGTRLFFNGSRERLFGEKACRRFTATTPEHLQEMASRMPALKVLSDTALQYNSGGTVYFCTLIFGVFLFF